MKLNQTKLPDVFLIEPEPRLDERGLFCRLFCKQEFATVGLDFDPVQMNLSKNTHCHTLRGMHYKPAPYGEPKAIRVVKGKILDVAVDIRQESPTYLQHICVELSSENMRSLFLPIGIAHGFLTLRDDTDVLYQMGSYYMPGNESGLRWDDPTLAIEWPYTPKVINERDANFELLDHHL
nr:dTDP-4-dehydrorhamnose 3,5-epimerase [uncultured Cohaesibacter sp.]